MSVDAYQALRNGITYAAQCWYADGMVNGREYGELTDALLAELLNHKLAVLNHLGTVREAFACSRMNNAAICPGEHQCNCDNPDPQAVFVVAFGAAAKECPKCGGAGWTAECCGDAHTTGDCCGSPVQVQCDCSLGAAAKDGNDA